MFKKMEAKDKRIKKMKDDAAHMNEQVASLLQRLVAKCTGVASDSTGQALGGSEDRQVEPAPRSQAGSRKGSIGSKNEVTATASFATTASGHQHPGGASQQPPGKKMASAKKKFPKKDHPKLPHRPTKKPIQETDYESE